RHEHGRRARDAGGERPDRGRPRSRGRRRAAVHDGPCARLEQSTGCRRDGHGGPDRWGRRECPSDDGRGGEGHGPAPPTREGDGPQSTTVRVLDWNRAPAAAVTVTAGLSGGGAESVRATTDAGGSASFVLPHPGRWMVSATTASGHGSRLDVQSGQEVTLTL